MSEDGLLSKEALNDSLREIISLGLGEVPGVGWIIEGLALIFWPESKEDIWTEIKENVEELIDKKLDKGKYQTVQEDLEGISVLLKNYSQEIKDAPKDQTKIYNKYDDVMSAIEKDIFHFQSVGHELLLLPLFAQLVNIKFALYRDALQHGKEWGLEKSELADIQDKLSQQIKEYTAYANKWYKDGYENVKVPTEGANLGARQWAARNKYVREMTLGVMDFAFYWPLFNPSTQENNSPLPKLTREIYSDPYGTVNDKPIPLIIDPSKTPSKPKARISHVQIWGYNFIDKLRVAYGGKWGPEMGGVDIKNADIIGKPPHGYDGRIFSNHPIESIDIESGAVLSAMTLNIQGAEDSNKCGGKQPGDKHKISMGKKHIVSHLYASRSHYYNCAEVLIVGFRLADSY